MTQTQSLAQEVEHGYARGWHFIRCRKSKAAQDKGWGIGKTPSVKPEQVLAHARAGGVVAMVTGAASGGLVVVDVDAYKPGAATLENLPKTVAVRTGGGGTHYYFRAPDGIELRNDQSGKLGKGIDVRGEGGYVVFPGSVHPETGALYEWLDGCSPDDVDVALLPAALIEKLQKPKPRTTPNKPMRGVHSSKALDHCRKYVDSMPSAISGQGGHDKTLQVACECCRFGLSDADAWQVLQEYNARCEPPWTEKELRHKLQDGYAKAAHEFGMRMQDRRGWDTPPGQDVSGAAPPLAPRQQEFIEVENPEPMRLAESFLGRECMRGGRLTLRRNKGDWYSYSGMSYDVEEPEALRARLYRHLDCIHVPAEKDGEPTFAKLKLSRRTVDDVADALPACGPLITADMPCWLTSAKSNPPAAEVVAMENGLLHLRTRRLYEHTPDFFSANSLPFPYEPEHNGPREWFAFLRSLFGGDVETMRALQEWFGYVLSRDARQQKILLMVGPKRSGKGTCAKILGALLGTNNVCSPTLSAMATQFGMQTLINKQLAVIGDARLSGRTDIAQVTERLLSISGQDVQSIPRKHKADWTGQLAVRFMVLSNELPRLSDASGALASRFIIIPLERSFYGHEDHDLEQRLMAELPGIFNWALEGYDRLQERGHFVQPQSGADAVEELGDLSSPVGAFVRDVCEVGAGKTISCRALYHRWREWCTDQGRDHAGTQQTFGRDLKANVQGVRTTQRRTDTDTRERCYEGIGLKW